MARVDNGKSSFRRVIDSFRNMYFLVAENDVHPCIVLYYTHAYTFGNGLGSYSNVKYRLLRSQNGSALFLTVERTFSMNPAFA